MNASNNIILQFNDKLCLIPQYFKRAEIIEEESKEYSEKSLNNNPAPENELKSSISKDGPNLVNLNINKQQSLDIQ
jgi:hypothetical protein